MIPREQWAGILKDASPQSYGEVTHVIKDRDSIEGDPSDVVEEALADGVLVERVNDNGFDQLLLGGQRSEDTDGARGDHSGGDVEIDPASDYAEEGNENSWVNVDFEAPEVDVWPEQRLARAQWMGRIEKQPFAPWGDPDHPD